MHRHLAIGDIHGCYRSLCELASYVGFSPDDVIITLGDYVNRGPNSRAVLDWLINLDRTHTLVSVRGNHEIMMLEARDYETMFERWIEYGGDATLRSYSPFDGAPGSLANIPESHWQFLYHRLVPYFETTDYFFVHANAYRDLPLDEQPDYMLYWEQFNDPPRHSSGKIMICGHTSQKNGWPFTNGNAICVDTNACRGGWLTCLHVESGQFWQANERGQTRSFFLEELDALRK